jgi:hypothetical protein
MHRLFPIVCVGLACVGGCASHELSGPPVNMVQVGPRSTGRMERSRGEAELYLTRGEPSHTFWNDWETKQDPWGTVTLKAVKPDGTVVVDLSGTELRARPGRVLPGTGIKIIASNPSVGTALLRTRWTHTIIEDVP